MSPSFASLPARPSASDQQDSFLSSRSARRARSRSTLHRGRPPSGAELAAAAASIGQNLRETSTAQLMALFGEAEEDSCEVCGGHDHNAQRCPHLDQVREMKDSDQDGVGLPGTSTDRSPPEYDAP
eukprot:203015-Heterocapsa_arctica.AAC.1